MVAAVLVRHRIIASKLGIRACVGVFRYRVVDEHKYVCEDSWPAW
jgi:hypothetical protein